MSKLPWFRFHWTTLNYHKLTSIAAESGEEPALVLGVWAGLLCIAGRGDPGPEGGRLLVTKGRPATRPVLAGELRLDLERLERLLDLFVDYGSIEYDGDCWRIRNWSEYQMASDNSTARVQRWRAKQKAKKEKPSNPGPAPEKPVGDLDNDTQALIDHFVNKTGLYPPAPGAVERWTNDWMKPTQNLLALANGDLEAAKSQMTAVVALMHKKHLKITRPKSLVNVTRRYLADQAWTLVRDEIKRVGANGRPDLAEELSRAVRNAGGWQCLCSVDADQAAERFAGAYQRGLKS